MFFVTFARLLKYAIQGFFRNFWLSFVCITTMVLAFVLVNVLGGIGIVSNDVVDSVKNKIDVSIYIKNNATEDQIFAIKNEISGLRGVKSITYISKKEALENFKKRHDSNSLLLNSLNELDTNPIGATLIIKADSTDDYSYILGYVSKFQYSSLIEDTNYTDNKVIISKMNSFNVTISKGILLVGLFFGFISAITVLNTLRITIYSRRREIEIMRFLGASWSFIKVPFILEAIFYLIIGWVLSIVLYYSILLFIAPYSSIFFSFYQSDIVKLIMSNSIGTIIVELIIGFVITIFASIISIRKYAKV